MENELKDFMFEILSKAILEALESFYNNDYSQFFWTNNGKHTSVYEVAMSCKLWIYIFNNLKEANFFEEPYSEFSVDMEYNKMWLDMMDKEIPEIKEECQRNSTDKIRPDIIIHKRGQEWFENNLCVFEIKKWQLDNCDRAKLKWFTSQTSPTFQYQYWIWLYNFKKEWVNIDLYQKGEKKVSLYIKDEYE